MLAQSAARPATTRRWVTDGHAVSERIGVEMGAQAFGGLARAWPRHRS
jgi:hypothetical protein